VTDALAAAPTAEWSLPADRCAGTLIGRVWRPELAGPSPVVVTEDGVFDISDSFPTVRDLCEDSAPADSAWDARGGYIGSLAELLANSAAASRDRSRPWLLAPVDLQSVKAAGVTFATSMLERVIEEKAGGDPDAAAGLRARIREEIGAALHELRPGSDSAARLKTLLQEQGMWSQYLEVGIGPDAEIFTKAPTLAAVGTGAEDSDVRASTWNNPEPEVALVVSSSGAIVGATLGNDVNLRDFEGRSALLLPKAKDNNASCALGPFLRLFDETFDLDQVRELSVRLEIDGEDGFRLDSASEMRLISRDPLDLVSQLMGDHHQYPDGAVLLLGTMFAPIVDRAAPGGGFTHVEGDVVRISTDRLGGLVNRVRRSEDCEPWTFGIADLMRNLAARELLNNR
jgi:fumarylacetoacetate (FAA) hydrolase family protein